MVTERSDETEERREGVFLTYAMYCDARLGLTGCCSVLKYAAQH